MKNIFHLKKIIFVVSNTPLNSEHEFSYENGEVVFSVNSKLAYGTAAPCY